jgi:DNA adenine methylase
MIQELPLRSELGNASFPETKYMGSKRRLLPFIKRHISSLRFSTVLDAFSGTGCVAHMLKHEGHKVTANDFLSFCFRVAHATVENNHATLTRDDLAVLLRCNASAKTFVRDTFHRLYFNEEDCTFLDTIWSNLKLLRNRYKQSLALAAACRASMKKRPRGLFTTTGRKGWDGRQDLKLSMRDQFLRAVEVFNGAVFDNGQTNHALNEDVFSIEGRYDLVYLDPPYISQFSDCDYTRRYHFVEGYCSYWKDLDIAYHTKTRKIKSRVTAFSSKTTASAAFERLIHHFRDSIIVISYSSNCVPSKRELVDLLRQQKRKVEVYDENHRYHHGNQRHKVGQNNNSVSEYLFIAS